MRVLRGIFVASVCTIFLGLLPAGAQADPIRFTSGSVTVYSPVEPSGASVGNDAGDFINGDGFGSLAWAGGQPGSTRTLDGTFTFNLSGPFGARIDGTTYSPFLSGTMGFTTTPFVVPAPNATGSGQFQTTFTMLGRVRGYSDRDRTPESLLFDVEVFGSGVVTGSSGFNREIGYLPLSASATYQFAAADVAATPEPASMFLLATGVAGLMVRYRKRV